ncbi:DUF4405 domain-containing protein [Methanocalculus taiwanensis]|uniref:DUF4405 domain-containing protein n=1 Tax=Methanocalculus taiwanensis TaxID=106207 RepID=A0ABD4TJB5_9EURY|nr:DUF4405 domain-containing protein [Methanocalculus taiwanensis]MCQ1537592.1 DUF4405 domain-containing protein [Methanocalculus taiwanensis]
MADMQLIRWCVDFGMAVLFFVTFVTGLFKWTLLMRTLGLTDLVMPIALMSDIHDWGGFLLGFMVALHLYMNRAWIFSTTRKMLAGKNDE